MFEDEFAMEINKRRYEKEEEKSKERGEEINS